MILLIKSYQQKHFLVNGLKCTHHVSLVSNLNELLYGITKNVLLFLRNIEGLIPKVFIIALLRWLYAQS